MKKLDFERMGTISGGKGGRGCMIIGALVGVFAIGAIITGGLGGAWAPLAASSGGGVYAGAVSGCL